MNIRREIDAYREMILDAKAWREENNEPDAKLDAQAARILAGDESDLYRLVGVTAPAASSAPVGQGTGSYSSGYGAPRPQVTRPKLASDKQLAFLTKLLAERVVAEPHGSRMQAKVNGGELTSKEASDGITWLLAQPKAAAAAAVRTTVHAIAPTITDGFYELDGTAYKVQLNQAGTNLYGKKLVDGSWEFVPGVVGLLTRGNAQPLSEELAAKLGHLYGSCVICSRRLTDEDSIAKGIGPICAAKQGW